MTERKSLTLHRLRDMHAQGEPIVMLTCYDASFARVLDDAGVDCLLVGDSLGMVLQGEASTVPAKPAPTIKKSKRSAIGWDEDGGAYCIDSHLSKNGAFYCWILPPCLCGFGGKRIPLEVRPRRTLKS